MPGFPLNGSLTPSPPTALFLTLSALALLASLVGVQFIRRWAVQHQVYELSAERTSQAQPTPRGGGLAILVIVLLIFMPIGLSYGDPGLVVRFALGGTIIALVGFADDLRSLPPLPRLVVQIIAAAIFLPSTPLSVVGLPGFDLKLSIIVGYILSLLWLVGLSNAYSFMDGIDGLAGGQAVIAGLLWALIGWRSEDSLVMLLGLLIAATSAGFVLYNMPPASIFMGDVGSNFLGYSLAALPLIAIARGGSSRLIVVGALFVGLFVFDAALTFVRRALKGENVLLPHRSHLYQRLVSSGESPQRVTLLYLLLSICFGIAGLIYWQNGAWLALAAFVVLCLLLFAWVTRRER